MHWPARLGAVFLWNFPGPIFCQRSDLGCLIGANSFLADGDQEYIYTWTPTEPGVYTFYAMAVGGVGLFGSHYTIGEPFLIEITQEQIDAFTFTNVAPMVELINPGVNTLPTAVAKAELGSLIDETDANYSKIVNIPMQSYGYGYSVEPEVVIYGGGGTGAEANTTIVNGAVTRVVLNNGGSGYDENLRLDLNGTADRDIALEATILDGVITSIPVTDGGRSYSESDYVNIFDLQNQENMGYGARAIRG